MDFVIIVEGKNDRTRLQELLSEEIPILCTYGTLSTDRVEQLKEQIGDRDVYLFLDNDRSGRSIRAQLSDIYPDADHLYTKKEFAGVEGTPDEHIIHQFEKAGLEDYIQNPKPPFIAIPDDGPDAENG